MYFSRSTYVFFDSFVNFSFLSGFYFGFYFFKNRFLSVFCHLIEKFYSVGNSSWKILSLYCEKGVCATVAMSEYIWDGKIATGKVNISQSSGNCLEIFWTLFGYFAIGIVYHTISVVTTLLLRWHVERCTIFMNTSTWSITWLALGRQVSSECGSTIKYYTTVDTTRLL